uniref:RPA43 OB domain-containing protein n=1 Tax=Timema bartmani TaxID=61472 RepID=A0A7R9HY39_9NEOP|nr:unnamed protein product [Timema bartmani]
MVAWARVNQRWAKLGSRGKQKVITRAVPDPNLVLVTLDWLPKPRSKLRETVEAVRQLGDWVRLQCVLEEAYRTLQLFLPSLGIQHWYYELGRERLVRVMVKGLLSRTNPSNIQEELEDMGFPVKSITQMLSQRKWGQKTVKRERLSSFHVKVENCKCPGGPVQCKNCFRFSLKQKDYRTNLRCGFCDGDHVRGGCPDEKRSPPEVLHCSKAHSSDWWNVLRTSDNDSSSNTEATDKIFGQCVALLPRPRHLPKPPFSNQPCLIPVPAPRSTLPSLAPHPFSPFKPIPPTTYSLSTTPEDEATKLKNSLTLFSKPNDKALQLAKTMKMSKLQTSQLTSSSSSANQYFEVTLEKVQLKRSLRQFQGRSPSLQGISSRQQLSSPRRSKCTRCGQEHRYKCPGTLLQMSSSKENGSQKGVSYRGEKLSRNFFPWLKGIFLGYENVKTQTSSGLILYDDSLIHIDIIADFYVFTPEVGCHLNGIVNKKSSTHIGCLVYKVFNVSIPNEDWVGQTVEIGQQVTFQVTVLDMTGRLPYIRGKLISAISQEESIAKGESNPHMLKMKKKKIHNMEEEIKSNTELTTSVKTNKRKYEDGNLDSKETKKRKKDKKLKHLKEDNNLEKQTIISQNVIDVPDIGNVKNEALSSPSKVKKKHSKEHKKLILDSIMSNTETSESMKSPHKHKKIKTKNPEDELEKDPSDLLRKYHERLSGFTKSLALDPVVKSLLDKSLVTDSNTLEPHIQREEKKNKNKPNKLLLTTDEQINTDKTECQNKGDQIDPISSLSKLKKKKKKRDHKDEDENNVSYSINNIIESVNIELSTNVQDKERTKLVGEMNDHEVYSKSKHKKNKRHHEKTEQQKAILDNQDYVEENSGEKQIKVKQAPTQKHFPDSESNEGKTAHEHISVVTTDTHVKKKKKKKSKDRDNGLLTLTENMLSKLMNQPAKDSVQDEVKHKKEKKKSKKNMKMEQSVNEQFCDLKLLSASSAGMLDNKSVNKTNSSTNETVSSPTKKGDLKSRGEKDSEHELNDISSLHLSADPLAQLIGDKQEVESVVNVPLTYKSPMYFNSSGMANAEDRKRKKSKSDLQKLQMISGILPLPSLKWMKQPSQSPSKNKLEATNSSPKTSTHRGQGIEGLSGFLSPSNTEIAVKIKSPSKQSFSKPPLDPHVSSSSDSSNHALSGTQTKIDSGSDNAKLSSAGQHNHHKSTEKLSPRDVDNDISLKQFLKESPSKPESNVPPKAANHISDNPMPNNSDSDCIENSQPPIQSENRMEGKFHAKKRISLQLIKSKIDLLKEKPSDLVGHNSERKLSPHKQSLKKIDSKSSPTKKDTSKIQASSDSSSSGSRFSKLNPSLSKETECIDSEIHSSPSKQNVMKSPTKSPIKKLSETPSKKPSNPKISSVSKPTQNKSFSPGESGSESDFEHTNVSSSFKFRSIPGAGDKLKELSSRAASLIRTQPKSSQDKNINIKSPMKVDSKNKKSVDKPSNEESSSSLVEALSSRMKKLRSSHDFINDIPALMSNGSLVSSAVEVINILGLMFAAISHTASNSNELAVHKRSIEHLTIDFGQSWKEDYNSPFTIDELTYALSQAGSTASGPDDLHYKMCQLGSMLQIFFSQVACEPVRVACFVYERKVEYHSTYDHVTSKVECVISPA